MLVYVAHEMEVVTRRTQYRVDKAREREHIVEGLVRALDMIDAIIELIRGAADVDEARAGLMAKPFEFSEIQANFILDMQLRRLTQLEGQKLRDELGEIQERIKELESILRSKKKLRTVIKDELGELRERYGGERRTRDHASTPASSTPSTSSRTKKSSSSCRRRATSRPSPPTRSAGKAGAAGASRAATSATTTTSPTC